MLNRLVDTLNRVRLARAPHMDSSYVAALLKEYGVPVLNEPQVEPLKRGVAGYNNFYHKITAQTPDGEVRYFASQPDSQFDFARFLGDHVTGLKYRPGLERKRKDYEDLRFLAERGIPASQPVAFDPKTGLLIEQFYDGPDLRRFLKNEGYEHGTKLEKCRQGLAVVRQVQDAGRRCGEYVTNNFLVKPGGQVIVTDMENESALDDPVAYELATFVFSTSCQMGPQEILRLARSEYPLETIRKLPRYGWRMIPFGVDIAAVRRTNEALKEF